MKPRSTAGLVLVLGASAAISALAFAPAGAQAPTAGWRIEQDGFEFGVPETLRQRALRARTVRADLPALRALSAGGETLRLDLVSGVSVDVQIVRTTSDEFNGHVIYGRVAGEPLSQAILVVEPDGVAGTVSFSRGAFSIRLLGDGLSAVHEADPTARRGDVEIHRPALPTDAGAVARPTAAPPGNVTWDLLAVFNKIAAQQVGGTRALKGDTKTAVAAWNNALNNSKVKAQVRLLATKKVNYTARGDSTGFASNLLGELKNGVGSLIKAHNVRNKVGADMVSMAIEINQTICGLGYVNGNGRGLVPADAPWAYHVNSVDCLAGFGGLTMAHEGGHNLGLEHDRANARTSGQQRAFQYSYGYRVAGLFATVMAYACSPDGLAPCPEIPYFSNPKLKHAGTRIGVKKSKADAADASLSLNKSRAAAAAWRLCKRSCGS